MIRDCRECGQEFNTECELPEEGSHLCPTCSRRLQIAAPALLETLRWIAQTAKIVQFPNARPINPKRLEEIARAAIAQAEPAEDSDPYTEERRLDQQDLFEERQREVDLG